MRVDSKAEPTRPRQGHRSHTNHGPLKISRPAHGTTRQDGGLFPAARERSGRKIFFGLRCASQGFVYPLLLSPRLCPPRYFSLLSCAATATHPVRYYIYNNRLPVSLVDIGSPSARVPSVRTRGGRDALACIAPARRAEGGGKRPERSRERGWSAQTSSFRLDRDARNAGHHNVRSGRRREREDAGASPSVVLRGARRAAGRHRRRDPRRLPPPRHGEYSSTVPTDSLQAAVGNITNNRFGVYMPLARVWKQSMTYTSSDGDAEVAPGQDRQRRRRRRSGARGGGQE